MYFIFQIYQLQTASPLIPKKAVLLKSALNNCDQANGSLKVPRIVFLSYCKFRFFKLLAYISDRFLCIPKNKLSLQTIAA